MRNNIYADVDAWKLTHLDDLWVFDKLILSKKLGYSCGPKGINVPKPGLYIVRPCINFMGMGLGTKFLNIKDNTDNIMEEGTFWSQVFKGKHLSIDYYKGRQKLCVEGIRPDLHNVRKWDIWKKTEDKIPYPTILKSLKGRYDWINVEFVGGNIIEIHLRRNPDFKGHASNYVIPVYSGQKIKPKENQIFIKSVDDTRIGFYIEKKILDK